MSLSHAFNVVLHLREECPSQWLILTHKVVNHPKKVLITWGRFSRATFIDPNSDKPLQEGQTYVRPALAQTFRQISEHGPETLYSGDLGRNLVEDLRQMGGIITLDDLKNYR